MCLAKCTLNQNRRLAAAVLAVGIVKQMYLQGILEEEDSWLRVNSV